MKSESLKSNAIPVLVGVGICLFFVRSGFLAFFFLVPLGFIAFRYDYDTAWKAFFLAFAGNTFLAFGTMGALGNTLAQTVWNSLYFAVMTMIFTWVIVPPPFMRFNMSAGLRLIAGSCLGALMFIVIFYRAIASPGFSEYVNAMTHWLVSFNSSSGTDVVQAALLDSLTPELLLAGIKSMMLRGVSLVYCIFLFFVSRQISFSLVRIVRRERGTPFFAGFHVHPAIIWAFSASLLLVVFTRLVKLEIPEIILWNILILCAILYLAQGLGILQFFLTKPSMPPVFRLSLTILIFILLFSPVINAGFLAGVVLLGIAENWVSFRALKQEGPPSTPEAGDGGN